MGSPPPHRAPAVVSTVMPDWRSPPAWRESERSSKLQPTLRREHSSGRDSGRRTVPLALLRSYSGENKLLERASSHQSLGQSMAANTQPNQRAARLGVGVQSIEFGGAFMPLSLRWMLIDDHNGVVEQMKSENEALAQNVRSLENELAQAKPQIPVCAERHMKHEHRIAIRLPSHCSLIHCNLIASTCAHISSPHNLCSNRGMCCHLTGAAPRA